ncbi:MAG: hypothetical protein JW731_04070 [Bacteroidales bacterium]|nr:hypothetical protein [Bacteroidales bacterium]
MKTVILTHRVKDFATWKPIYDADNARRTNAGLKEIAVGADANNRQEVYMIFQTQDIDRAMKMMNDPDLAAAMERAGVISKPKLILLD